MRETEPDDPEARLSMERAAALQRLQRSILFEDSRFLVLNKPSGMAVHGGSGLSYGVIEGLRALRPDAPCLELAHRLDRDTSGCLVVARRRSALRAFQKEQQERRVHKHYLALVQGRWQGGKRRIEAPLMRRELASGGRVVSVHPEGKPAVSLFSPAERFAQATLMRVKLLTGRTHQIRVHARHAGHPVAGDGRYGDAVFNREMAGLSLERLFLHAGSIRFTLPAGKAYEIRAPLEEGLALLLTRLGRPSA